MTPKVRLLLAGVLLLLFGVDFIWGAVGHFDIDYGKLRFIAFFSLLPVSVGLVYSIWRPDERMACVMFSMAFLLLFTPLCTQLNYLAVSIAGPRIDTVLASYDRMLGINWPDLIASVARYPFAIDILGAAYAISAFQVAVAIALLGYRSDVKNITLVCISTVVCAWTTIAFWTLAPSFGAYTVYDLSAISHQAGIVIDRSYPDFLVRLLAHGPRHIDVLNAKGLIGFPSFHTEEIVIAWWYLRKQHLPFALFSLFSLVALVSVPVQGGHHVVDVLGGVGFAAFGIWSASGILRLLEVKTAEPKTASFAANAIE